MNRNIVVTFAFVFCLSFTVIGVEGHNPGYEIVAVYGSTPTIDGSISVDEWDDAASISATLHRNGDQDLNNTIFVKQDGENLYIGFNISDNSENWDDDFAAIFFDIDHDGGLFCQPDDIAIVVYRNGTLGEANLTSTAPIITNVTGWTASVNSTSVMWQAEFNITYSKIGVTAGVEKTLGVAFHIGNYEVPGYVHYNYTWPPNILPLSPSNWGDMTSNEYNWIPEFSLMSFLSFFIVSILFVAFITKKRMN